MERVQAADEGMLFWFENHHRPWLSTVMKGLTHAGDRWTLVAVLLAATAALLFAGRRRTAVIVLMASALGFGIALSVKHTVKRQRPDVAWRQGVLPSEPSFPSGHALNSMAIYGALGLTEARRRRAALRGLLIALGLGLPILIGLSRPYRGVHYPTDVLAGWTAGLACALLAYWADRRWGEPATATPPAAVVPRMTATGPPDERVTRPDERVSRP